MKEFPEGEVEKQKIASFEDQIRVSDGKPQLYGTQFRQNPNGDFEPFPIEDIERLDKRRRAMGLQSFEFFIKKLKEEQGVIISLNA